MRCMARRTMWRANAFAVFLLLWPGVMDGWAQTCIAVSGPEVTAADFAGTMPEFTSLPPEKVLLASPRPGVKRILSPAEVARLLPTKSPAEAPVVCVERGAGPLQPEELVEAVRQAWTGAGGGAEDPIELLDYPRMRVPPGMIEFQSPGAVSLADCHAGSPLMIRGRLRYDRNQSIPLWAKVHIRASQQAILYRRDLAAGSVVEPADIEARSVTCGGRLAGGVASAEQAAGMRLRVAVRAGEMIRPADLAPIADVIRGETVEVRVEGIEHVVIKAKALTGGRRGEAVLLENPLSGAKFKAAVAGRRVAAIGKETRNAP